MTDSKKILSLTVGIPTYHGGPALVRAAESILASEGVEKFRIIVSVDGNPLKEEISKRLRELGVDVIENTVRGGQVARIKQMIALCNTDILVLTQDDIQFEPTALAKIAKTFADYPDTTMIGARVKAAPAESLFESAVEVGVRMTHYIGDRWNNENNYLLSSGRCLAFQSYMAKQMTIPEEVINSDAYLYFENKRLGGVFRSVPEAIIYNKSPQKISEHIKQSKKFEYSQAELSRYLHIDLASEYAIPKILVIQALAKEFIAHPIAAVLYMGIHFYTKFRKNTYANTKRFWDTDVTTKR